MGQYCALGVVLFVLLASLALILIALLTDNWYKVYTPDNINPHLKQSYNYHYGLWRLCYEDMPAEISTDVSLSKEGSCIYIHHSLIQKNEDRMDFDSRIRIHLSRTVVGCNIAAAAMLVASLLLLICGVWPGDCSKIRRPCLYLTASILLFLATLCGLASGICFIAVRDLDNVTYKTSIVTPPATPPFASQEYHWSFMLLWIGTGLAFVDSFILLWLMKNSYDMVHEVSKYSAFNTM